MSGKEKRIIDLSGPEGNVFFLFGIAKQLAEKTGKNGDDIVRRMKQGNYRNAVAVFKEEFGDHVELINE